MKRNSTVPGAWVRLRALPPGLALLAAALLAFTGCQTYQNASTQPGAKPAARSEPIILREGDVVNVSFLGSPNLNTTQQIRRDGKIVLPLVGEVEAAGTTPEKLQSELIKLYSPQIATKQIVVTVQSSTFPVYVTGAVLRPGRVQSDHPLSALDAIMEAGGFDYSRANLKGVMVIRRVGKHLQHFRLNLKREMSGQSSEVFYLKPSDIIYVPEKFTWF